MSFFKTLDTKLKTVITCRLSNVQNIALCIHIFKEILHLHNRFKKQIYCEIQIFWTAVYGYAVNRPSLAEVGLSKKKKKEEEKKNWSDHISTVCLWVESE